MSKKNKKIKKVLKRSERLLKEHGWKLDVPPNCLPEDDRCDFNGGLKCFGRVYNRDDFGNKIIQGGKRRCRNPAVKGSFFCKKCGGGNSNALIHGKRAISGSLYRGAFQSELGDLFNRFVNDPSILDLTPELAALKTCFTVYLKNLSQPKNKVSSKKLLTRIGKVMKDEDLENSEKFVKINEICMSVNSITDGENIDRLVRIIDVISKVIDRINRLQNRSDLILTPDGLKILFRCIVDILKENIEEGVLKKIKGAMMTISVRTQGDLTKYAGEIPKNIKGFLGTNEVKEISNE